MATVYKLGSGFPRVFRRGSLSKYLSVGVNRTNRVTSGVLGFACYHGSSYITNNGNQQESKRFLISRNQYKCFHSSSILRNEVKVVKTPGFADSISEGDIRWEKAVGDHVAEDDVIGEVETDKTSIPIPAPCAGVIEELLVEDGGRVEAHQDILKIRVTGDAPPPKAEAPKAEAPKAPQAPPAAAAPPLAARPTSVAGPIPTRPPLAPAVPRQPISSTPASSIKSTPLKSAPEGGFPITGTRAETRVKMNRMRIKIASRLKEAQNTCAMLTTFNELDMSNIMELRKTYQDQFVKKHGIKIGFMSAFIKASAFALQQMPVVNAVIDETEVVYRDFIDMSVAVATPKGLVVPVLRNVEAMNYADIEKGLADLGEKARTGSLAIEDMDGGTFTISNGGVFGSLYGTPIINPPQSAILGMHGTFPRPVAINGKVEIRPMMYIALTYDHRLLDGRDAVLFLKRIKNAVEDPRIILLDL